MANFLPFRKNSRRFRCCLLGGFILAGCSGDRALHWPFFSLHRASIQSSETDKKEHNSDQFAPGEFSPSCRPGDISVVEGNILSIGMRMSSDGKWCALEMERDEGGHYLSFGVPVPPEHGKAYLYDADDGVTYVAYRPESGYSGSDIFRVFLLPGRGKPRRTIEVRVTVTVPDTLPPPKPLKLFRSEK